METIRYFTKDALQCFVYEDRGKMGKAAARDIIAMIVASGFTVDIQAPLAS